MAKVLVVDDNPDNVRLLGYELNDGGFEVVTAFDGHQALGLARSERPDVILLDVMMPGIDGIETCRRLKADPDLRPIPVIMVSARDLDHDVIKGLDVGACDYITKPFNARIVLARVRSAARSKADHDLIAEMNTRLAELATTDGLTDLRNHRYFREALRLGESLAARKGLPLSVVLLDVDQFKPYNDTFGHPAGDDVLRTIAAILQSATRSHDVVARYGGEEFALLLTATNSDDARALAERLRRAIERHDWPHRPITASVGVATWSPKQADPVHLVKKADQALYRSKQRGRNQVTHYDDLALHTDRRLVIGCS